MYKVGSIFTSGRERPQSNDPLLEARVSLKDHDTGQQGRRGLSPIEICPECGELTLSEIVLCKGANIAAHKGRWYQVVRNWVAAICRQRTLQLPYLNCI